MSADEANALADELGLIPAQVQTNIYANTGQAMTAIENLKAAYASIKDRTVQITTAFVETGIRPPAGFYVPGGWTGGSVGAIAGYAAGGRLPGQSPSDPTVDNLFGMTERGRPILVRSGEWIVSEPASDWYGDRLMSAINNRVVDRDALASLAGFATGGRPSANYAHTGVDNATAYAVPRAGAGAGYGSTSVTKNYTSQVYVQRASVAEVQAAQRAAAANDYEPGGGWG